MQTYDNYGRSYYLRNKEKIGNKFKDKYYNDPEFKRRKNFIRLRHNKIWRNKVLDILGNKCLRCGFSDERALQVDHINGDGFHYTSHRSGSYFKQVYESIEKKENRFQLLCCNCNWIKRVENKEYAYRGRYKNGKSDEVCRSNKKDVKLLSLDLQNRESVLL